ncbi:MAG: hypothetical protein UY62_C0042G0001 [Parcubacteria group bacterium GW2011_GWF2_50_9]|nr:MAG: hypothetical protein UY62_C0042G0001 [Parcubacteria group bacterium GW2011_GWF2_50_9]
MRKYERNLNTLRRDFFWAPDGSNTNKLVKLFHSALKSAINHQGEGPLYPRSTEGGRISNIAKYSSVANVDAIICYRQHFQYFLRRFGLSY